MAVKLKKIITIVARACLSILSCVLALFILFDLALAGTAIWLNTPSGQNWAKPKIMQLMADSPYTLNYKSLFYSMANGLTVTGLAFGDQDGAVLELDRAALRVHILSAGLKQVSVGLAANHVIVHRLPKGEDKPVEPVKASMGMTPFQTDSLFLTGLVIDDIAIHRLDLREPVLGQAVMLSPRIRARVHLGEQVAATLDARLDQVGERSIAWLPDGIRANVTLDPRNLLASIKTMAITAPSYQFNMSGTAGLNAEGQAALNVNLKSTDLETLAKLPGEVSVSAVLSGATYNPDLSIDGRLVLASLVEKGLPEVLFKLQGASLVQSPAGTMQVSGLYQDVPLQLTTAFSYDAPALLIQDIQLTGPDLSLTGNVALDTGSQLAEGKVVLKADDLATYAKLAGQDIAGRVQAEITLSKGAETTQSAALILGVKKARYQTYTVEQADLKTAIADLKKIWPQTLDLVVRNAVVGDAAQVAQLGVKLNEQNNGYGLRLDGQATAAGLPVTLQGKADLADLTGSMPTIRNIDLNVRSGGSLVNLKGQADSKAVGVTLATQNFNLADLPITVPETVKTTRLTGTSRLNGPLTAPVLVADFSTSMIGASSDGPNLRLSAQGAYRDGQATLSLKGTGNGVRALNGQAGLPMEFSLSPFVLKAVPTASLTGTLDLDLDGKVFADSVLPPDHRFAGAVRAQGTLAGTVGEPDINATISLQNARYDYTPYNVMLRDLSLSAKATRSSVILNSLSATDGEDGRLSGSGQFDLANQAKTKLKMSLKDFHLFKSDEIDGRLDAALDVDGRDDGYAVGGKITLGQFDIVIPEQFHSKIPQLNIVQDDAKKNSQTLNKVMLDIAIHAESRIFARGWGLDAEFGGNLEVGGTLDAPQINGDFQSVRGRYEEFGKRFALARANLRFQGAVPPSPYLDIEATTDIDDITASVLLTGPVTKPGIKLASTPALPEDEVMSRILFGETMSKITPFQAIQLTQTLQRFSGNGGGGFDPLGQLRSLTGLDDIRVDTDAAGESSVGVGKYLTDKVYLEVERGRGEASGAANLQIEVTPSITLESKIGQDAQGGAGVFWSRDY